MSRYFKYNYLNPNNFGTRRQFFRHRGCATDHSKHYHLNNLDNWPDPSEKGNWVLEKSCFFSDGDITIEPGQTLCIASGVRLTLYGSANPAQPRIIIGAGGRLNIFGELLCVPSVDDGEILTIEGHLQIEKTGILENYKSPTNQNNGIITFSTGTFLNKGLITNKGEFDILQELVNNGHINNTGTITGSGSITGNGTCTGCP